MFFVLYYYYFKKFIRSRPGMSNSSYCFATSFPPKVIDNESQVSWQTSCAKKFLKLLAILVCFLFVTNQSNRKMSRRWPKLVCSTLSSCKSHDEKTLGTIDWLIESKTRSKNKWLLMHQIRQTQTLWRWSQVLLVDALQSLFCIQSIWQRRECSFKREQLTCVSVWLPDLGFRQLELTDLKRVGCIF